ncbi:MAG: SCO family protein [Rhodospirillaceae bacterium]|nr:SCO family protein [Rhodospirillaceae bacterium]
MLLVLALYLPGSPRQQSTTGATGTVAIGGPFTLVDSKGVTVTDADLKGRYSLVFFGFTRCPDICPLVLQVVTQALELAGPAADKVQPVFISVDPERDSPEVLGAYIANFHPRFVALTGTVDQVRVATQSYRVYAAKAPLKDSEGKDTGDYTVSHTGYVYLMDRDGGYLAHFQKEATAEEIARRLGQLAP